MKTIRNKLMSIYMIATAVALVAILLLFNFVMRLYFIKSARDELKNTYSTMNVLTEKQLMNYVVGQEDTALSGLSAALTASRLSGSTEFYVLDENFQILFPTDGGRVTFEGTMGRAVRNYDYSENSGAIKRVMTKNGTFYITGKAFDELASNRLYIVFITGMAGSNRVIGAINLILIVVMLVSLAVEFLYAAKSARGLSRPIQQVCSYAKEIGNGRFIMVPQDRSLLEIHELTCSINEMSIRLKAADEAQNLFLQNASHELRTPLMSIQGYSEAIEKGIADPAQAAAIIKTESIRLTALVEELITLSKIDSHIYDQDFIKIDVGEALSECVYRLNGLALKEQKEILLRVISGVVVLADENLLAKAINNVLSNCLRYAKKTVTIELSYQDDGALIRIADDGDGIAPADLPHIFDRFYKGEGGKFGLGLAIAKKALEIMGGSITAQNGEQGAVFELRLPAMLLFEE